MPRGRSAPFTYSRWASQVAESSDPTNVFLGSPSLLIASDGTFWASHVYFYGDTTVPNQTVISKSTNKGGNWTAVRTITGLYWSSLFEYSGALYGIGVSERNATTGGGDLVIFKSTDGWVSAPTSTTIFSDFYYQTAGAPIVYDGGYLLFACTTRTPIQNSAFKILVAYADLTDIMDAGNWSKSNQLAYDTAWNLPDWDGGTGSGWQEPMLVNDGGTFRILARMQNGFEHKAAKIGVTWNSSTPSCTLSFGGSGDFIDLLGGGIRFEPVYHSGSGKWLIVSNHRTAVRAADPDDQRDEQWLCSSSNLTDWTAVKMIHGSPEERAIGQGVAKDGFQYTSNVLSADEDVLHTLTRTAWRGADTEHNSNRITYDFIPNLNALLGA